MTLLTHVFKAEDVAGTGTVDFKQFTDALVGLNVRGWWLRQACAALHTFHHAPLPPPPTPTPPTPTPRWWDFNAA